MVLASFLCLPDGAAAADGADYSSRIRPLLKQRCYACHGPLKRAAGLRLDTGASIRKGGDGGPAVVAGESGESLIIDRVTESDPGLRMPPDGSPLTQEQVESIRSWIDHGAASPAGENPESDPRKHWAFQRVTRPAVPAVLDASPLRNPIDVFLQADREALGVKALGDAPPVVMIRRLYIDLIGLPPTPAQIHEFRSDPSDARYERIVDRLLASPQHGERWARHWMDVWRYSDWYGRRAVPDVTNSYAMIWRWRDWIVRSLNRDRGYDWMLRMMLAADELAPTSDEDLVATGFVLRNFYRWNYNSWMKDNVEHTARAFLGLTIQCAHCHDHKYDPLTQRDYFALRACFEPIQVRHDRVPGEPDPGPFLGYEYGKAYGPISSGMVRIFDEKLDAQTFLYTRGESRNVIRGKPPIEPGAPAFLKGVSFQLAPVELPAEASFPGLKPFVREEELRKRADDLNRSEARLTETRRRLRSAQENLRALERGTPADRVVTRVSLENPTGLKASSPDAKRARERTAANALVSDIERQLRIDQAELRAARADVDSIRARIQADLVRFGGQAGDENSLRKAASRVERGAKLARAEAVLERALVEAERIGGQASSSEGKKKAPPIATARSVVEAARAALTKDSADYTPLAPAFPTRSTGRRKALAGWITAPENPLTARVAVNHLWRWHFHQPIVATTADFGRNGKSPTHPALLDWLASELIARGWQMKAIHRLIVTSSAYRMASHPPIPNRPELALDPENRRYWRQNPARLEAEVVRDSLLATAGSLDPSIGGADIDFDQGFRSPRRTIYLTHHGEGRMPFLELFDAPDACEAYSRSVTVIPQQALSLTNNDLARKLGDRLAKTLWAAASRTAKDGDSRGEFIRSAFESVLGRGPSASESMLSSTFLDRQEGLFRSSPVNEGGRAAVSDPRARARANLVHALYNHNDFLTIH